MRALANNYHKTSEYLSGKFVPEIDFGSSQTLLRVLAFEVLLKAVHLADSGEIRRIGHDYAGGWYDLSEFTQKGIVSTANDRFAGHVDYNDMPTLLIAWRKAFTMGRYSYEALDGQTDAEASDRGKEWIESGARAEEADFAFYPIELDRLIFGINEWLDRNLATNSS